MVLLLLVPSWYWQARAKAENLSENLKGFKDTKEFVASLKRPRRVMFLVKAGQVYCVVLVFEYDVVGV